MTSEACDCIIHDRVEKYANEVEFIFTGTVIELLDSLNEDQYPFFADQLDYWNTRRYTAKVLIIEILKTGELISDTVEFTSQFTNCDPIYELGKSYLFFADTPNNIDFQMTWCTPWGNLSNSEENLKRLRRKLR